MRPRLERDDPEVVDAATRHPGRHQLTTTRHRPDRRALLASAATLGFLLVAALTIVVAVDPAGAPGDGRIGQVLAAPEDSAAARLAGHVSALGSIGGVALLAVALAAVCWWCTHDARLTALCVLAPGVAGAVQWLMKEVVHRRAPGEAPASALSFPSGHATGAWALAVAAVFVALAVTPQGWIRRIAVGGVLAGALAVTVGRVVTGDHFATDVVAGALLGTSVTLAGAALLDVTR